MIFVKGFKMTVSVNNLPDLARVAKSKRVIKANRITTNNFSQFQSSIVKLNASSRIATIRKGFESKQVIAASDYFDLDKQSIADIIGISMPTLNRKLKSNALLSPNSSERLARIALIEAETEKVFGTTEKAKSWLLKPHLTLGDVPLALLDTDIGASEVKRVLNAIAYGGVA